MSFRIFADDGKDDRSHDTLHTEDGMFLIYILNLLIYLYINMIRCFLVYNAYRHLKIKLVL